MKKTGTGSLLTKLKTSSMDNVSRIDVDSVWSQLSAAIDQIYTKNASDLSFEALYRLGYNLVLAKQGDFLYKKTAEKISDFDNLLVGKLIAVENDQLLKEMCEAWEYHKTVMETMAGILLYVDRTYCKLQHKLPVYSLSLKIFLDIVIYHPNICKRLRQLVLENINIERNGGLIDRDMMRTVISMYQDVSIDENVQIHRHLFVYEEEFETPFLSATRDYYRYESMNFLAQNPISDYFHKVETRLNEEDNRLRQYLSLTSQGKLKAALDDELISAHITYILGTSSATNSTASGNQNNAITSTFMTLMRDNRQDDLKRLYNLLSRVPSTLDQMRDCIGEYTRQSGLAIVQSMVHQSSPSQPTNTMKSNISTSANADVTANAHPIANQEDSNETSRPETKAAASTAAASTAAASNQSIASQYVNQILELQQKLASIINQCFKKDKKALQKQQDAFDFFINHNEISSGLKMSLLSNAYANNNYLSITYGHHTASYYLATYLDEILKSNHSDNAVVGIANEMELDQHIEQVLLIFRHISDKDLFEYFYKSLLSKRLLSNKKFNDDLEKIILSKFKAECGYQYTSKMEGMFKDIQMSKIVMEDYQSYNQNKESAPLTTQKYNSNIAELELQILTAGYWPLNSIPSCRIPDILQNTIDTFLSFYMPKNNGKRLSWLFHLGTIDMKANFGPGGRKELNISTYQGCILMCFNKKAQYTLQELNMLCNIPELEFRRHLLSLCTPKLKILKKSSTGKGISDDDVFTFNEEFTSKFKRIKVPLISMKEVSTEKVDANNHSSAASVEEDRKNSIDASIVRIMKARKRSSHHDLIAEVTKQLSGRFNPLPQAIKNRIESLIEREYLERDVSDSRMYIYLA